MSLELKKKKKKCIPTATVKDQSFFFFLFFFYHPISHRAYNSQMQHYFPLRKPRTCLYSHILFVALPTQRKLATKGSRNALLRLYSDCVLGPPAVICTIKPISSSTSARTLSSIRLVFNQYIKIVLLVSNLIFFSSFFLLSFSFPFLFL